MKGINDMKKFRKLISIAMIACMLLAFGAAASAADTTYTITIKNDASDHTYEAYQIFAGNLDSTGTKLSNIVWGSGVNGETLLAALADEDDGLFPGVDSAAAVADALTGADADAVAFAKVVSSHLVSDNAVKSGNQETITVGDEDQKVYKISGLKAGYYLVKDADDSQDGEYDAYTSFILEVVADTTTTKKSDVPSVIKKVEEKNDSTGVVEGWQDAADYDIGDAVPFQLTGTLPSNYADYSSYTFIFHDTLSTGLTFNSGSVKAYINEVDADNIIADTNYSISTTDGLHITFADLTSLTLEAGDKIIVEYTATLNKNAVIGADGNTNEVYLEYSNNPNPGGEGDTGNTPKDIVIVFTYEVDINKVDGDNTALPGAGFTLYKYDASVEGDDKYVAVGEEIIGTEDNPLTTFEFSGLDAGMYKLEETTVPDGFNKADDVLFTITATYDVLSNNPGLLTLTIGEEEAKSVEALSLTVINLSGATLPSTGGIGRTIFIVVGAALMIGAVVLLVAKKKATAE